MQYHHVPGEVDEAGTEECGAEAAPGGPDEDGEDSMAVKQRYRYPPFVNFACFLLFSVFLYLIMY